ncbi:MAG TPA: 2-hydroxyacyl-CoA dehydratase family protein [Spirochaetia bacterium]|nr:2-hydroxyacyl-CoA dehydratase family protein [Spirochaetia bacterium]
MTIENYISRFAAAVDSPYTQARRCKAQGQKVIGWLLTDVPEELIHAAGAFPVGILGSHNNIRLADTHVQVWMCSLMRSSLEMGLAGELDFLDGVVIPHTCDTARMIGDIWRRNCRTPYVDSFLMPRQVNRRSAREYLIGELGRLKRQLEQRTGEMITAEKLHASIRLFNENRRLLRRMREIHAGHPGLLTSRQVYTVIKAAMYMDKAEHNRILRDLVRELEEKADEGAGVLPGTVRLVISGGVWEPPETMDLIDGAGGVVVGDDLHTGARYLGPDPDEDGDGLAALADRQLNKMPFCAHENGDYGRARFLIDLARRSQADGLLFLHLKFCEPENYDYHDLREALKAAAIPNFRLETEFTNPNLGQIRTRLEAFIEMIGRDSIERTF